MAGKVSALLQHGHRCRLPLTLSMQSTYLRQVALIAILAHMGSYVPATFATVPLLDGIFTRIGTADSIEHNSSSFMLEMQVLLDYCNSMLP